LAIGTLIAVGVAAGAFTFLRSSDEPADPRPNVLVIVTDDQRARGTLDVMPAVRRWFAEGGTRFASAFTTTPLCCPARSSIFSGRYVHNHGVKHNVQSGRLDQAETIQQRLHADGYRTAIAGKFLNHWDPDLDPPNFDRWAIFLKGEYYDRIFNIDGEVGRQPDYSNTVVLENSLDFVDDFEDRDDQPWFLYVGTGAAHAPFTAEPAYEDADVPRRRSDPALAERDTSDKPGFIARREERRFLRRKQLRTLMSADDLVDSLLTRLDEQGELDNTIAVFMSDNGMLWGEHGFTGKRHAYTDSIRVPLFLRWPGHVAAGAVDDRLAANIDIAPTLAGATGVAPLDVDGRSLLGSDERKRLLIEHWGDAETTIPDWASLRSAGYQYVEYYRPQGNVFFREFYDLQADPFELTNLVHEASRAQLDNLHKRLAQDRRCLGRSCP
jgi:arylsulfatase A-like enzyme